MVHSSRGMDQSKPDGPLVEARRYHPGIFRVRGGSGIATGCEYSTQNETPYALHTVYSRGMVA